MNGKVGSSCDVNFLFEKKNLFERQRLQPTVEMSREFLSVSKAADKDIPHLDGKVREAMTTPRT